MELNRDLVIYQGDDIVHKVILTNNDGSIFNIIEEGAGDYTYVSTIKMQGETSLSNPGELLAIFNWNSEDVINLTQGTIIFTLDKIISKTLPPGRHIYDVKQIDTGSTPNVVLTLFSGLITILPEVTKEAS